MHIPNVPKLPTIWTDRELEEQAQASIDSFVDRRLREPQNRYREHLADRKAGVIRLIRALTCIDRSNPDLGFVREILFDPAMKSALRYVAGPPISEDDLAVLATRSTNKLTKKQLKADDALAASVLELVCTMADPARFPWTGNGRKPMRHELKHAIRATAALHAAQSIQTERRGFGREVERALAQRLVHLGFAKVPTPNKGKITAPTHWPEEKTFFGECTVYGRKADLLIGLPDGRIVAVEAKDSSSALNSIKRVLNDTAAKAKHWHDKAGEMIIPMALLSGVFKVESLKSAQASGLYLIWTHDIDSFLSWLSAQ